MRRSERVSFFTILRQNLARKRVTLLLLSEFISLKSEMRFYYGDYGLLEGERKSRYETATKCFANILLRR